MEYGASTKRENSLLYLVIAMNKCFFCGEREECVLEDHHVIPKTIQEKYGLDDSYTITLCANCHRKIHYLLNYIFSKLNIVSSDRIDNDIKCYPNLINSILESIGNGIDKLSLITKLREKGYSMETINNALNLLKRNGEIYEPKKGFIKRVE